MFDQWMIIPGLILVNGLFSLAEASMEFSRKAKLEAMAKKGSSGAKMALELTSRPARYLSVAQLGIAVTAILTGLFIEKGLIDWIAYRWISAGIGQPWAGYGGLLVGVLSVTFLFLIFGVLIPRRLGMHSPEKIAALLAPVMNAITEAARPARWLMSATADALLRIFGIKSHVEDSQVTEEEVIEIIAQGTSSGTIEEVEQDMLERVLLLGDRSVASLMTNRIEIEWLNINDPIDENISKIVASNHSLFPVCNAEIDRVIGILPSKRLLSFYQSGKIADLKKLLSPVKVIPENMKALAALEDFKVQNIKMAVVVDEFGSVQGLLTQSDLFESIIAEHDTPDEENEISIVQRDENSYLIDALLPFEEFLQYFEIEDVDQADKTGFHSLGGFILHLSKQIPATGERFEWKNYEFEVVDMDGNRIDKLLVTIKEEAED